MREREMGDWREEQVWMRDWTDATQGMEVSFRLGVSGRTESVVLDWERASICCGDSRLMVGGWGGGEVGEWVRRRVKGWETGRVVRRKLQTEGG
jgi:hypothetical protein